jgi:hypothetical protein
MAWKQVENYYLGYNVVERQFYFYYKFKGEGSVNQHSPSPEEFVALADMFRNEGPITYNTDGNYFVTDPEAVGEGEAKKKSG